MHRASWSDCMANIKKDTTSYDKVTAKKPYLLMSDQLFVGPNNLRYIKLALFFMWVVRASPYTNSGWVW